MLLLLEAFLHVNPVFPQFQTVIFLLEYMRKLVEVDFSLNILDAIEVEFFESLVKLGVSLEILQLNILERLDKMLIANNLFHL